MLIDHKYYKQDTRKFYFQRYRRILLGYFTMLGNFYRCWDLSPKGCFGYFFWKLFWLNNCCIYMIFTLTNFENCSQVVHQYFERLSPKVNVFVFCQHCVLLICALGLSCGIRLKLISCWGDIFSWRPSPVIVLLLFSSVITWTRIFISALFLGNLT